MGGKPCGDRKLLGAKSLSLAPYRPIKTTPLSQRGREKFKWRRGGGMGKGDWGGVGVAVKFHSTK